MRKLASLRKVLEIIPIAGADAIELVRVDGWQCVVKKGLFKPSDWGVYFEIDSFLPESDARFSFLKNPITFNDVRGFRIKTMKLRGALSQGLFLPMGDFPEVDKIPDRSDDLTNILGIQKWEPPVPAQLAGEVFGYIPGYLHKTDQERIQNFWVEGNPFNDGREFEVTVKLDGASAQFSYQTVDSDLPTFLVCSRNMNIKPSDSNTLWKIAYKYDLHNEMGYAITQGFLKGRQLSIQGEVIGEGIQGNPEKLKGQDFYVFDIYDIAAHCFVSREERLQIVEALGLKHVPVLETRKFDFNTLEEALAYAEGPSLNPQTAREGVVFKAVDGSRSFKIISNSYLLKHGDR